MLTRLLVVLAAAAIALPLGGARAAPQALGLVATNGPVPLRCFAGECAAEFSAFCLQQARDLPAPGTAYRAVGDALSLIVIAADGKSRRLPGAEQLTFVTERSFTAVRIALPKRALEAFGAVRAAVEVGARITLVPVAVAGDPNPQSDLEIATATGPLRATGERLVDNSGAAADAMRITERAINALPERGRVGAEAGEQLWRETVANSGIEGEAVARANEAYGSCRQKVDVGFNYSLRNCLKNKHDQLILELNVRYWRATVGS
ncbi:MAG: hypothetical protein IH906_02920 [Proteobacteria bacterium]|nr:hypothetical protein [Pseudomonadota bacterium]